MGKYLLVFCEIGDRGAVAPASLEVLGLARELSGPMKLEVAAAAPREISGEVAECGPSCIYIAPSSAPTGYFPEWYASFLGEAARLTEPEAVLFAHTPLGQDLAPRLAQKLGTGLVTDAAGIRAEGKKLLVTKAVYGGVALATYSLNSTPQIITLRSRLGKIPPKEPGRSTETVEVKLPEGGGKPHWELVNRIEEKSAEIKLEEAQVVVSGGRGLGGPEGFELLRELAGLIGAAVGASRPPCDSGWIPSSQQVGITGKVISPQVYIAVAISGASQHLSGMGDAKKIVAINKDPDANIFKTADYGAVGDCRQILPAMIETLEKIKSEL
ncbi:MAG: electron transfer flavoprotein subunit alpha/FixB family protein [Proteobacteria bacterium]|nr:electron transfer flavoprotein subunit alpha/FixB family protein [Pseudomonadota bacterium]